MRIFIFLFALTGLAYFIGVTFYGSEIYRFLNGPEPVKAKVIRRHR